MKILLSNERRYRFPFDLRGTAEAVIAEVLRSEKIPAQAEVSVSFTNDETIRELNAAFRGKDEATDVLSFPASDETLYRRLPNRKTQPACYHPKTGDLLLGDIVISVPRARAQAKEYGHGVRREIAFLIAHSCLHLLGYDHMTEREAKRMETKQEAVLQNLHITREDG